MKQLCVADEQTPPAGLCARHLWSGEPLSFEARDVANAKEAPYGARGDGLADDSAALQKAIDENERVFLPKGHYLVSRPIRLRPNTKLFGVSPICSNILIREPGEFFSDAARPSPVLETPDVRQGGNTLAFLSVTIPHDAPGAIAFRHQSGGGLIRSCRFAYHFHPVDLTDLHAADFERLCPLVVATGSAGGKWYMHYEEMPVNGPRYRHLLIEGTSQPLAFYQLNIEHAAGDAQMEIRDSRNIRIFGFKSERNAVVARIDNSRDIALHSCGGNATPFPGKSLIELIDCKSIRLENLVDLGRIGGKSCEDIFGLGINPMLWTSVHSERDGETFATKPCERPACFIVDWQPVT
ncbi:MAG: Pectate lyase superfamily protein [candidate division BRC1 bacterium ADurb.BinA364]|nr:MAG: Pectate lyase superfamily protein [candidate division BRC1 bacterium ADurb.BinA364]